MDFKLAIRPFESQGCYECVLVRGKFWLSALLEPLKAQPSISSATDVCHQFPLADERIHFCTESTPIKTSVNESLF